MIVNAPDIRWKQRYSNFKKALDQMEEFVKQEKLNKLEAQGLIKAFEYTYELGWNVLKDYLEFQGNQNIKGSRDAITEAFSVGLIDDGEAWMDMFASRNETSHTYNELTAREIVDLVLTKYADLFRQMKGKFSSLSAGEDSKLP